MQRTVGDAAVNHEVHGEGTPILMIHGRSPDLRLKGCAEPLFETSGGDWKRIYFDLPGTGLAPPDPGPHGADWMLDVVESLVDRILPGQRLALVGESFGGCLARGILPPCRSWTGTRNWWRGRRSPDAGRSRGPEGSSPGRPGNSSAGTSCRVCSWPTTATSPNTSPPHRRPASTPSPNPSPARPSCSRDGRTTRSGAGTCRGCWSTVRGRAPPSSTGRGTTSRWSRRHCPRR